MAVRSYQWLGGSGDVGVAGNWSDTTNDGTFSATGVPTAADTVYINSGNLTGTGSASYYWINNTATFTAVGLTATTQVQQNTGTLTFQPNGISPSVLTTPVFRQQPGADLELPTNTLLNATGTLTSPTNGFLDSGYAIGTVNITGGKLNAGGQFFIGNSNANSAMTVSNAGTFNAWVTVVSSGSNDTASLTVTGGGSAVNVVGGPVSGSTNAGGYVIVGANYPYEVQQHGTITVTNGASFFALGAVIDGSGIAADGTIIINGGATFTNGTVGASVSGNFAVGGSGGHGFASVSGLGHLVENGYLTLGGGDGGSGTLDVGPGGAVNIVVNGGGGVFVGGFGGTAPGTITVHGAGAVLDAGVTNIGVGTAGPGVLALSQGGTAKAGSGIFAGNSPVSPGTITVDGAGSSLLATAGSDIYIGHHGAGTLSVSNGANVRAEGQIAVGKFGDGRGSVVVSGGTLSTPQLIVLGEFAGATGSLTVNSGAISAGGAMIGGSGAANLTMTGGNFTADTVVAAH